MLHSAEICQLGHGRRSLRTLNLHMRVRNANERTVYHVAFTRRHARQLCANAAMVRLNESCVHMILRSRWMTDMLRDAATSYSALQYSFLSQVSVRVDGMVMVLHLEEARLPSNTVEVNRHPRLREDTSTYVVTGTCSIGPTVRASHRHT